MAAPPYITIVNGLVPAVKATAYTSNAVKTRIDYMAVANVSAVNVTFSVWLGPADALQRIKDKTVLPNETYLCSEVIGALLEPGGMVQWQCSAANALYGAANGVQFT